MERDIANIERSFTASSITEIPTYNDIIWKKAKIKQIFEEDPDLMTILGKKEAQEYTAYADPDNPTEEELEARTLVDEYNEKITHDQIVPFLKLNNIQEEVLNFVMFDIEEKYPDDKNDIIKQQFLTVMVLCHENDMETEYDIERADLLAYIVIDLLNWSNDLGIHLKLYSNVPAITDSYYYGRTLKFYIPAVNTNRQKTPGIRTNVYDNLP